ncbi:MAG: hypothetical protein GYB66_02870 [Chloroflexi bacterium]|nr:hypothetical protein [Chloroflexota bacterium]
MRTYVMTGIVALALGIGLGLYLGWIQFPVEYEDSRMCQLDEQYQEDYTLMVARGYQVDGNLDAAIARLRPLRVAEVEACNDSRPYKINNIPDWVEYLAEQYISEGRDPVQIRDLVALAAGFERVTPAMESFLPQNSPVETPR